MFAIYKKELLQYFTSMIGFVFLAFFLVIMGIFYWTLNIGGGSGNFEYMLGSVDFLFVILIPILTMRVIAEENRQKTDQLLYTSPVSITKVVVGKYLAVFSLFTLAILVVSVYPLILHHYNSEVQLASAYSGVIGFWLMGGAYIAIGLFVSSLTESQLIAAIISFIVMIITYIMPTLTAAIPSDGKSQVFIVAAVWILICVASYSAMKNVFVSILLGIIGEAVIFVIYGSNSQVYDSLIIKVLNAVSISDRYDDFRLGILEVNSMIYYLSISFLFVFLTIQMIKRKRFN
ncbi:MAG: ABC transporter permease subunit [Lachnospiraceae bacterium]|nr:ABC transporter permease subunit [Lachnospiraceae bacterium]